MGIETPKRGMIQKTLMLVCICISIVLLGTMFPACFPWETAFSINVTNKTSEELIVYVVVWPTSEFVEYYMVGIIPPGKSVNKQLSLEIGGPPVFKLIAEKNMGQNYYYNPTVLPASNMTAEYVYYSHSFTREEFARARHQVTITVQN